MAAKRAAQRRQEHESAELPPTLIPPGEAADKDRSAYWIDLFSDVDALKAATDTTDFFVLLQEFPAAVWDRLTVYLYRLTDDAGMLIKNADDKPHYIKVLRQPLTEEFVSKNWGGGKYQALLKIDNKEVLRKHTFRIDGDPKVQPGQRVEVEGKIVPLNGTAAPQASAANPASDIATVIEASSKANDSAMGILAHASETAISMVRDQAANAAKPDAQNGIMEKFLVLAMERMMTPPPAPADPIETFLKLQGLINKQNPEPAEVKDPPIVEAMELVEKMSGGRSFAELMKGKGTPAPESVWAPFAPVALQFVTSLPGILAEFRMARMAEQRARDMQFKRDIWMRSAKPGETPPLELLAVNEAPAQPQPKAAQPAQPSADPSTLDPSALVTNIVQMVCHGFDNNPYNGQETAAAIAFNFGKHIEAAGLEIAFTDPDNIARLVEGTPLLKQRSAHAKWPQFQAEFMEYMSERFGDGGVMEPPAPGPQPVPQPVA